MNGKGGSMMIGKNLFSKCERDGLTLQEIASMMNLTKERVRQIEAKALNKLRQSLVAKAITHDVFLD